MDYAADTAQHRVLPDARELVYSQHAAGHHMVLNRHVAGQSGVVGHDNVVAKFAVMRDMDICHEEIIVTHGGHSIAAHRAQMHGDVLPDPVVAAHNKGCLFPIVLQVLWDHPYAGIGEQFVVLPKRGVAVNCDVRDQAGALAYLHFGAHHAQRAYIHSLVKLGPVRNDGRGMDLRFH